MTDDTEEDGSTEADATGEDEVEEKSFRERVEEIRQKRAEQEGEEGEGGPRGPPEGMMGGGGGGGGGGNPFAQMMGGMMGGGPGGMGGGMGGGPRGGQEESVGNEELVREVRKLRDEVHDVRRTLDRIADALED